MSLIETIAYILWGIALLIAAVIVVRWLVDALKRDEDTLYVTLDEGGAAPTRAFLTDAGLDLYSPVDIWVPTRGVTFIDTRVHIQMCEGEGGEIRGRSGLSRRGILVANGTIDSDYRGSLGVLLYNVSDEDYHIHEGDRIAQLVIVPVALPKVKVVDVLNGSERDEDGFGSTGR